jgi:hypothetical protein
MKLTEVKMVKEESLEAILVPVVTNFGDKFIVIIHREVKLSVSALTEDIDLPVEYTRSD